MKQADGQIVFPQNRSTNYTTNTQCDWVIQVPIIYAVEVKLEVMDLEYDKECYYDSLSFYDGKDANAPLIGHRICGDIKPLYVRSTSYYMTVRFTSDYAVVGGGFKLNWTIIQAKAARKLLFVIGLILTRDLISLLRYL